MDKENIFRSSQFHMDSGDVLHILIKNLVGTFPNIELYDKNGNVEDGNNMYGLLYNWFASSDLKNITSIGFHVATEIDIDTLLTFLGGTLVAGGKLKYTGTYYWNDPNAGADNSSGFGAKGAGMASNVFKLLKLKTGILISDEIGEDFMVVANDSSDATISSFLANWSPLSTGFISFHIDVATDMGFTSFAPGYQDLDVGNVSSITVNGLIENEIYYYRVKGIGSDFETSYSNIIRATTALGFSVTAQGDGSGVTMFYNLTTTDPVIVSVTGIGRFYSDAAGTLDESSYVIVNGTSTFYLRCAAGVETLLFNDARKVTYFGVYGTILDANSPIIGGDLSGFINLINILCYKLHSFTLNTADLQSTLISIEFDGAFSGLVSELPINLVTLIIAGNTLSGNILDFSSNIITINIGNGNSIDGDIQNIPIQTINFSLGNGSSVFGDIMNLSINLVNFSIQNGTGNVSGDFADLKEGLTIFSCSGLNHTYGTNIGDLPSTLITLVCQTTTILTGDVINLPSGLTIFYIVSNNLISGNINNLPVGLTNITLYNGNVITGLLSNLPNNLNVYDIRDNNTISGQISDLPANVIYANMINGNIAGYTSGRTWANNMSYLKISPILANKLTSTEVDNILIDASSSTWVIGSTIDLAGVNDPRTIASNAAVVILTAMGVIVTTN